MGIADTVQGSALKLHQALYERSDGRVGHRALGVPTLLLRSTGRRSGRERCNALVYVQDGPDYVLVASNGGDDRAPSWLANVRSKPAVEIQVGREKRSGTATVLERGAPDFERLWRLANENNHNRYDVYQTKTERSIALVVVNPL